MSQWQAKQALLDVDPTLSSAKMQGGKNSDQIESLVSKMENKMLQMLEEDKQLKNQRFSAVFTLIDSNKSLLDEHIAQQFESLKSLTKAYVNKEVAERMVGDQSILGTINKRLDGIDNLFDSRLREEIKIMEEKL